MSNSSPFRRFLFNLFEANEKPTNRKTDELLSDIIRNNFEDSSIDSPLGRHKTRLRIWRSDYNTGRLGTIVVMSFRYNSSKLPCTKSGKTLSAEIVQQKLDRFKDERSLECWFSLESQGK